MKNLEMNQMEKLEGGKGNWVKGLNCAAVGFLAAVVTANPIVGLVYGVGCNIGTGNWTW